MSEEAGYSPKMPIGSSVVGASSLLVPRLAITRPVSQRAGGLECGLSLSRGLSHIMISVTGSIASRLPTSLTYDLPQEQTQRRTGFLSFGLMAIVPKKACLF